jgi:hypothetical protein
VRARDVLGLAIKYRETADLEERVTALEKGLESAADRFIDLKGEN